MIHRLKSVWKDWTDPDDPHVRMIRLEQLKLAARNSDASLVMMPVMALAIAGGLAVWAPWQNMAIWYAMMLPAFLLSRRFLKPYVEGAMRPAQLKTLTLRFASMNGALMVLFSTLAPLAWPVDSPMGQALVQLVLAATMASVTSITGPSKPIFLSDIAPPLIAGTLTPLVFDGWVGVPMALLSVLFGFMMIFNARGSYELAETALTLNDANLDLIHELRSANAAKSEFLANMSHELRTPLNAILGFSEVMKDEVMGPMGNRTYRGYAADIHGSGQHLLSLVNDILDLAKIEAGKMELADDRFSMDEIVDIAFGLFRVQAEAAGVALVKDVAPEISVRWDMRAAKQIAINLMSNALKFTPKGGSIIVTSREAAGGGCYVRVADTGVGIAPEDQARVFEAFGQGRHDLATTHKSTGLGLAIVRGLVEMHGGTVSLESTLGEGTVFTIHVPAERTMIDTVRKAA